MEMPAYSYMDRRGRLCIGLATGYPINPVYEKMEGIFNLDRLHDGTWWHMEMMKKVAG